jgi:hypothetical protein
LLVVAAGCGSSPAQPTPFTWTGDFSGTYQITSCSDGPLTGFCAGAGFTVGAQGPITLSLGQNGTSVSGTVALGSLTGTFQGTATGKRLSGSAPMMPITSGDVQVLATIIDWSSTLSGNSMTGTFTVTFAAVGIAGNASFNASIVTLKR